MTYLIIFLNLLGECNYSNNVIRGVFENSFLNEQSRYTILDNESKFTYNTILSSRIIIYK